MIKQCLLIRPVSVLLRFSKLLEKLIYNRLLKYINKLDAVTLANPLQVQSVHFFTFITVRKAERTISKTSASWVDEVFYLFQGLI